MRFTHAVLIATAHHEAGHAVAAIVKGVPFRCVTICATGDAAGQIFLKPGRGIEQTHRRGIVALAGEAAQRRFNPHSIRRYHAGSDRDAVIAYATECTGSPEQAELLVRLWTIQARDLILSKWATVSRVAAALISAETLEFADCSRIVWQR